MSIGSRWRDFFTDAKRTPDLCGPEGLRANNFDIIRFFMAVFVIFSHSYPIAKGEAFHLSSIVNGQQVNWTVPTEPLKRITNGIDSFGGNAVNVFFILSGFLIAMSWERSTSVWNYLKRRILRIYPGFIVAMLFCAVIICPLFTVKPVAWSAAQPAPPGISAELMKNWTLSTSVLNEHWVPGVFVNNPDSNALNSSVWTIRFEFGCYLLIIVLGALTIMRRPVALFIFYLIAHSAMVAQRILKLNVDEDMHKWLDAHGVAAAPAIPHWFELHRIHFNIGYGNFVYHFDTANFALFFDFTYLNRYLGPIPQWTGMITLFSVGMVFYAWRNKIPKRLWLFALCSAILLLDLALCATNPWKAPSYWAHQAWPFLYPPLLGYIIFWLAFQRYLSFPRFARFGDFSYGMYLYAFPVQQSLQALFPQNRSAFFIFLLATPITFILSVLSWYGVERYFIRKKNTRHAQQITHLPAEALHAAKPFS